MRAVTLLLTPEQDGYHTFLHAEGVSDNFAYDPSVCGKVYSKEGIESLTAPDGPVLTYRGYSPIATTLEDAISVEGSILEDELGDDVKFYAYTPHPQKQTIKGKASALVDFLKVLDKCQEIIDAVPMYESDEATEYSVAFLHAQEECDTRLKPALIELSKAFYGSDSATYRDEIEPELAEEIGWLKPFRHFVESAGYGGGASDGEDFILNYWT